MGGRQTDRHADMRARTQKHTNLHAHARAHANGRSTPQHSAEVHNPIRNILPMQDPSLLW